MEPRPLNTKIVYVAHLPEYCPGLELEISLFAMAMLGVYYQSSQLQNLIDTCL